MAFGRLPNGLGTITKLKANLRKPYRARKLVGEDLDEQTMKVRRIYRTVGYFGSRKDAMNALMNDCTISSQDVPLTFANVYAQWSEKHYPTISTRTVYGYKNAYKQFAVLHDRAFRELKAADYEQAVKDVQPTIRQVCRVLLSLLYKYAIRNEIVERDYSKMVQFDTKRKQTEKKPFTVEEVEELWKMPESTARNVILIGLYSGFCPAELVSLDLDAITNGCFIGGMKTKNGINRLVPIHPSILPLVETERRKSAKSKATGHFVNRNGDAVTYAVLVLWMKRLFPEHSPHEMRHSFATYARRSGMDPVIIKRILGHSLKDLTEEVYTHVDADILIKEMAKYRIA